MYAVSLGAFIRVYDETDSLVSSFPVDDLFEIDELKISPDNLFLAVKYFDRRSDRSLLSIYEISSGEEVAILHKNYLIAADLNFVFSNTNTIYLSGFLQERTSRRSLPNFISVWNFLKDGDTIGENYDIRVVQPQNIKLLYFDNKLYSVYRNELSHILLVFDIITKKVIKHGLIDNYSIYFYFVYSIDNEGNFVLLNKSEDTIFVYSIETSAVREIKVPNSITISNSRSLLQKGEIYDLYNLKSLPVEFSPKLTADTHLSGKKIFSSEFLSDKLTIINYLAGTRSTIKCNKFTSNGEEQIQYLIAKNLAIISSIRTLKLLNEELPFDIIYEIIFNVLSNIPRNYNLIALARFINSNTQKGIRLTKPEFRNGLYQILINNQIINN